MRVVTGTARIHEFVNDIHPLSFVEGMQGIGLERDGELIAGTIYEGYNPHSIWMHVAAIPGARWLTRDYLRAVFRYPFVQLGVNRVGGWVEESNMAARKFDEHLGFREEARLRGAARDGGDVILYVMWRDECRWSR
jgi:RimJ/RimL family protein N-acetyltransferase